VLQLLAGVLNIIRLAPLYLQLLHLILTDLIRVVFVLFTVIHLTSDQTALIPGSRSDFSPMEAS
jgi:hypothetical protein